jgi:hypothetical protein
VLRQLSAASTAAGPDGDRLVATTFIQRIATTGGLAPPAADCNATTAGTVAEVPYTADYYFWKQHRELSNAGARKGRPKAPTATYTIG